MSSEEEPDTSPYTVILKTLGHLLLDFMIPKLQYEYISTSYQQIIESIPSDTADGVEAAHQVDVFWESWIPFREDALDLSKNSVSELTQQYISEVFNDIYEDIDQIAEDAPHNGLKAKEFNELYNALQAKINILAAVQKQTKYYPKKPQQITSDTGKIEQFIEDLKVTYDKVFQYSDSYDLRDSMIASLSNVQKCIQNITKHIAAMQSIPKELQKAENQFYDLFTPPDSINFEKMKIEEEKEEEDQPETREEMKMPYIPPPKTQQIPEFPSNMVSDQDEIYNSWVAPPSTLTHKINRIIQPIDLGPEGLSDASDSESTNSSEDDEDFAPSIPIRNHTPPVKRIGLSKSKLTHSKVEFMKQKTLQTPKPQLRKSIPPKRAQQSAADKLKEQIDSLKEQVERQAREGKEMLAKNADLLEELEQQREDYSNLELQLEASFEETKDLMDEIGDLKNKGEEQRKLIDALRAALGEVPSPQIPPLQLSSSPTRRPGRSDGEGDGEEEEDLAELQTRVDFLERERAALFETVDRLTQGLLKKESGEGGDGSAEDYLRMRLRTAEDALDILLAELRRSSGAGVDQKVFEFAEQRREIEYLRRVRQGTLALESLRGGDQAALVPLQALTAANAGLEAELAELRRENQRLRAQCAELRLMAPPDGADEGAVFEALRAALFEALMRAQRAQMDAELLAGRIEGVSEGSREFEAAVRWGHEQQAKALEAERRADTLRFRSEALERAVSDAVSALGGDPSKMKLAEMVKFVREKKK